MYFAMIIGRDEGLLIVAYLLMMLLGAGNADPMTHSPVIHSPHLLRPKSEGGASSSFTPVSSGGLGSPAEGGPQHVGTPPRPMSTHTPGGMPPSAPGAGPPSQRQSASPASSLNNGNNSGALLVHHPHLHADEASKHTHQHLICGK